MRISDWSSDVCSSDLALWYPVKQRRALQPFLRQAMKLPAKSALVPELLVRPDDSPLRMNGSGLLVPHAPRKTHPPLQAALQALRDELGEPGASPHVGGDRTPPPPGTPTTGRHVTRERVAQAKISP